MSFFKHVSLADYDITDKDIAQACYDDCLLYTSDAADE